MAYRVESRANTAADTLREALSKAERQIIQPSAASIEPLLELLDQIEQMVAAFDADEIDIDLRPELARWESLQSRLQSTPGVIARAASAAGGMKALRSKHPPATGMWWRLDELHASRVRKSLRRTLITIVTVLVVVVGGWQLVNYFFPPDPVAVMVLEASNQIEDRVNQGDLPGALKIVDEALKTAPDSPEMLVWSIVLAERNNDPKRAERDLAHAKRLFAEQLPELWAMIGNQRYQLGDLDGAEAAANQAIAINDREAQAYLLLASVYEARGDAPTAIQYFEKTYELADNNPQLQVVARYRMGQLMQQAPMMTTSTPVTATNPITTGTPISASSPVTK